MAKTGKNQKMKMLAIYTEIAANCRGEKNAITTQELVDRLNARNIACDGRVLSREIGEINKYILKYSYALGGVFDTDSPNNIIIRKIAKHRAYCYYYNTKSPYLNNVDFDFGELRFFYDAVSSAYFMPLDMVNQLCKKLDIVAENNRTEKRTRRLYSYVYLKRKYYHKNDGVLKIADGLCRAINANEYVSFKYCNINKDGELVICKTEKGEDERIAIPLALRFKDGYYYLHAIPVGTEILCSFRLDKMREVHLASVNGCDTYIFRLTAKQKEIIAKYKEMDTLFLFMGETWENKDCTPFSFRFTEKHIGDVLDKFGMDTAIKEESDGWYSVNIDKEKRIQHTNELYAWFAQFGTEIQIAEPPSLIKDYKNYLNSIVNMYKQEEKE